MRTEWMSSLDGNSAESMTLAAVGEVIVAIGVRPYEASGNVEALKPSERALNNASSVAGSDDGVPSRCPFAPGGDSSTSEN